ncbi:isocitrate lyase [Aureococcus anophagefferens]|nr:isocitrate lyase [Aureococcus anophagefferens]
MVQPRRAPRAARRVAAPLVACLLLAAPAAPLAPATPAAKLRALLGRGGIHAMPCCYDGITARLVERAGFELSFMTGFGVAAARGYADAGLVSYGEMQDSCRIIAGSLESIPFIADGDTGYGNACNVARTVRGYAQVGAAGVMIEDQVSPKRCGHTRVKAVVGRAEAASRARAGAASGRLRFNVRAACDARDALAAATGGAGVVVVARTDANAVHGFDEAVERCLLFRDAGADVTFLEAPTSREEMEAYCARAPGRSELESSTRLQCARHWMVWTTSAALRELDEIGGDVPNQWLVSTQVPGWKLANMLEGGKTPVLPPRELAAMGYTLAAYPLTLLSAGARAQTAALGHLARGAPVPEDALLPFGDLCDAVGFTEYFALAEKYELE